ncbi:hypothetical protein AMECASPLE_003241 [Ameca splendens]|uniref:Uncharacterized protein n=1 Tax=Ameca splendens TaxID=208324 RepID=A0ABV0XYP5_9TELE
MYSETSPRQAYFISPNMRGWNQQFNFAPRNTESLMVGRSTSEFSLPSDCAAARPVKDCKVISDQGQRSLFMFLLISVQHRMKLYRCYTKSQCILFHVCVRPMDRGVVCPCSGLS